MNDSVVEETLTVATGQTGSAKLGNLKITVRDCDYRTGDVVIGRPGGENIVRNMTIGDAVLYETQSDGLIEVRMASSDSLRVMFLINQVSPRRGIAGGFVEVDPSNLPFDAEEVRRIEASVARIKARMAEQQGIPPEKLDLIYRRLDEMGAAAERMGRKDWINLAAGTLTSIVVTVALDPDSARTLFLAADSALSWLVRGAIHLLP